MTETTVIDVKLFLGVARQKVIKIGQCFTKLFKK